VARTAVIELTSRQLSDVLRQSAEVHSVAAVISGLSIPMSTRLALSQARANSSTSRSLVLGLIVLAAFPGTGETRRLSEVAKELEMSPSTAHRYLHTLITLGLIERDEENRRYRRTSIPSGPRSG
jgi:hypothetical protein